MTNTNLIQKISNKIWNQSGKHTHAELDALVIEAFNEGKRTALDAVDKEVLAIRPDWEDSHASIIDNTLDEVLSIINTIRGK